MHSEHLFLKAKACNWKETMVSNPKLFFLHELQAAEGKKVSRAESWRYEASIYVSPGRQKPSGLHVWDINKLERNKRERRNSRKNSVENPPDHCVY
jgi:hypothetical protein